MDQENTDQLDQSNSTAEVATGDEGATAKQTHEIGTNEQPPATSDWRVQKYGADWENSGAYWKDTSSHWRDEYDKEKKKRQATSRGIEHPDDSADQTRKPAAGAHVDDDIPSKFEGETTEDFKNFMEKRMEKRFESMLEMRERESMFKQSLAAARQSERGDPENGIPSFDEIEEAHLAPLVKQTRADRDILIPKGSSIIRELLRYLPDPGKAAYTLGVLLHAKDSKGLRDMFAGQGREELAKKINDVSKGAATLKNGSAGRSTGKMTPEEIKAMPKEQFEKLVAQNTGRTA